LAPSPAECKLCTLVVGAVAEKVGSNATEAEVEQALDNICAKLGGFKGVCETFVQKYTPELIALLVNDLNASSVCIKLGLCPKADGTFETSSPVECTLCKVVVGKLVSNLTSNSTEAEIEKELEKVCDKLGGLAALCADFVEKYTPELIAILATDLNATSVCQKLGLCPNSTLASLSLALQQAKIAVSANPKECRLCEVAIAALDAKLDQNSTVEEIEAALDKVCDKFGAFKVPCENLIKKYTPELIALLINDLNATRVCTKLGLCTAQANVQTANNAASLAVTDTLTFAGALGTQRCTEGPAYWCSSLSAATQCNAVDECKNTAWLNSGIPQ